MNRDTIAKLNIGWAVETRNKRLRNSMKTRNNGMLMRFL